MKQAHTDMHGLQYAWEYLKRFGRESHEKWLKDFMYAILPALTLAFLARGDRNASFRMVLGYWDMAASLVTTGAIDADAFRAAHGEIFAAFGKIQPFLAELRAASSEPEFCRHMENVVMAAPDAEAILKRRREALRNAVKARVSAESQTPA